MGLKALYQGWVPSWGVLLTPEYSLLKLWDWECFPCWLSWDSFGQFLLYASQSQQHGVMSLWPISLILLRTPLSLWSESATMAGIGKEFKPTVGIAASHITVPGFKSCSTPYPCFLLMHTLQDEFLGFQFQPAPAPVFAVHLKSKPADVRLSVSRAKNKNVEIIYIIKLGLLDDLG